MYQHAARLFVVVLFVGQIFVSGCVSMQVSDTGRTVQGRPVMAMGACCSPYDPAETIVAVYADEPKRPDAWWPVCDANGRPYGDSHKHDAYFTGDVGPERATKTPSQYRYEVPATEREGGIAVDLERSFPGLAEVSFYVFQSNSDGKLTEKGTEQVRGFLEVRFGSGTTTKRLGEGSFAVAWKVCPKGKDCIVVKIRKIPSTYANWQRRLQSRKAAMDLKRDLAVGVLADRLTARVRFLSAKGKPAPMVVGGKAMKGVKRAVPGPSGRLARTGTILQPETLREGVVMQRLIAFNGSKALDSLLAQVDDPAEADRQQAYAQASAVGVSVDRLNRFFDTYRKASDFGPEVIETTGFVAECGRLGRVDIVAKICRQAQHDFSIPDDFLLRVRALEQLYRDTAGEVIRFNRRNFDKAMGNRAADHVVREIGLDFNHGRNAGWDPDTRQFVLFDY